jgi:hypothetical protein
MKKIIIWLLSSLAAISLTAAGWEWQFAVGPWTLQPLNSPVERLAERIVADEARELLAPLLGDFTILSYQPEIAMRSQGKFFRVGLWRQLAADRFAIGLSADYLRSSLPFSMHDEQEISYQGIPIATISTRSDGRIDLRTFILAARGRWRAWQRGRSTVYVNAGMALLRFRGDLHLPLAVRIRSILGDADLSQSQDMTLDELRQENDGVPVWSAAPVLGAALYVRLGKTSRLFIDAGLSQGTFLAAGVSFAL